MLRYFSRSELGKNCTPIFSPVSDFSIGNTGKTSFYSALWVLSLLLFAQWTHSLQVQQNLRHNLCESDKVRFYKVIFGFTLPFPPDNHCPYDVSSYGTFWQSLHQCAQVHLVWPFVCYYLSFNVLLGLIHKFYLVS